MYHSLSLHVGMFLCMSTRVMCIYMYTHAWRLEINLWCCPVFWDGALVGIWWLSIMLSYLASKPHGSACLCLLSAGILSTYNHTRFLIQVLGIKIMSSCLRASVLQTELFYFLDYFRFILCLWVFCIHVCMCTVCMTGAHGSQMKAMNSLKLELQIQTGRFW